MGLELSCYEQELCYCFSHAFSAAAAAEEVGGRHQLCLLLVMVNHVANHKEISRNEAGGFVAAGPSVTTFRERTPGTPSASDNNCLIKGMVLFGTNLHPPSFSSTSALQRCNCCLG